MPLLPRNALIAYAGLLLVVLIVWANVLGGQPIFDDHWLVVRNGCFRTWSGVLNTLQVWSSHDCAYRPTRYLSYGVDRVVLGDHFWAYHLGNIVRHGAVSLVAGWLATGLFTDSRGLARADRRAYVAGFVVALLWALHPVQTDSVSYVSGRRDILVGLYSLATLGLARWAHRRGGAAWVAPLATLCLALLSKENAVVVPVLYVFWVTRSNPLAGWIPRRPTTWLALVVAFGLALALAVQRGLLDSHSHRGVLQWWGGSLESNMATVAALQLRYLRHVFTGGPLIGDYHAETIALASGFGDPRALLGVVAVVGLLGVAVWQRARRPLVSYGVVFYLVALLPMSHIIPHHELYAEHYLYVPLFGATLAWVAILDDAFADRWAESAAGELLHDARLVAVGMAVGLVAMMMAGAVVIRNAVWADETRFYESVVERAPTNQRALGNLLYIYADTGRPADALVVCGAMAPQWVAGSAQERQALLRCAAVAAEVGDLAARGRIASQLAQNHPTLGAGWRHRAETLYALGRFGEALSDALQWFERTGSETALLLASQAAATSPDVSLADVDRVDAAARRSAVVLPGTRVQLALALARRGAHARAVAWLSEAPELETDPAVASLLCQIAAQGQIATPPGRCP